MACSGVCLRSALLAYSGWSLDLIFGDGGRGDGEILVTWRRHFFSNSLGPYGFTMHYLQGQDTIRSTDGQPAPLYIYLCRSLARHALWVVLIPLGICFLGFWSLSSWAGCMAMLGQEMSGMRGGFRHYPWAHSPLYRAIRRNVRYVVSQNGSLLRHGKWDTISISAQN